MVTKFSKQFDIGGEYDDFTNLSVSSTAFTELGTIDCKCYKTKTIFLTAETTDLSYKIMGSIDGGANYDITAASSATLTAGNSTCVEITDYYTDLTVQGAWASTSATSTGTLSGKYAAVTL